MAGVTSASEVSMNIFILARDPDQAAKYQCDKHVPKMLLEAAQMLCNAFPDGEAPYKRTHYNHRCSRWARETPENFQWLLRHAWALAEEYRFRFGRMHATEAVLFWVGHAWKDDDDYQLPSPEIQSYRLGLTPNAISGTNMDRYRGGGAVASYRRYYAAEKARFAKWERGRSAPPWWRRYLKQVG